MYEELGKIISPLYMVGGSVRDELIGRPVKDYDFATPLCPDEIEEKIRAAGKKPYLVGKRFGTIGVRIDDQIVEITTFRAEKYQPRNRKPEVEFVRDINVDLSRRDFTINAMARRGEHLTDPFGGAADIQAKTIRAVGNPKERFKEDPLRMLRAVRFAAELDFQIEKQTMKKITEFSSHIIDISHERWSSELDKIIMTTKPSIGFEVLMATRLLNFIIPELAIQNNYDQNSPHHKLDLWHHSLKTLDNVPNNLILRWAAILHDVGKPFSRTDKADRSNYVGHEIIGCELVKKIGHYLRWPGQRIKTVSDIVGEHMEEATIAEADSKAKE